MLRKRIMAFIMVVAVLMGMVPGSAFAADESQNYGTVESISAGITYKNDIFSGQAVEATFAGTLQKAEGAWQVGLKINAPENYNPELATYTTNGAAASLKRTRMAKITWSCGHRLPLKA